MYSSTVGQTTAWEAITRGTVALLFIAQTALVYASNAGRLGGQPNSQVSRKFSTLVTPASYTFSIWGVIFAWETLCVAYACVASAASLLSPPTTTESSDHASSSSHPLTEAWSHTLPATGVALAAQAAWVVFFSREKLLPAALALSTIAIALALALMGLAAHVRKVIEQVEQLDEEATAAGADPTATHSPGPFSFFRLDTPGPEIGDYIPGYSFEERRFTWRRPHGDGAVEEEEGVEAMVDDSGNGRPPKLIPFVSQGAFLFWFLGGPLALHGGWTLAAALVSWNLVLVKHSASMKHQIAAAFFTLFAALFLGCLVLVSTSSFTSNRSFSSPSSTCSKRVPSQEAEAEAAATAATAGSLVGMFTRSSSSSAPIEPSSAAAAPPHASEQQGLVEFHNYWWWAVGVCYAGALGWALLGISVEHQQEDNDSSSSSSKLASIPGEGVAPDEGVVPGESTEGGGSNRRVKVEEATSNLAAWFPLSPLIDDDDDDDDDTAPLQVEKAFSTLPDLPQSLPASVDPHTKAAVALTAKAAAYFLFVGCAASALSRSRSSWLLQESD